MQEILYDEIPSLDLADFTSGDVEKKAAFVQKLGQAWQNIGFVAVKNHGLSDSLTERLYDNVKHFFSLEDSVKSKYENAVLAGQRGYIGKNKEHAKGRTTADLKEFYHVGQTVPADVSLTESYPDNIFPTEIPDFAPSALETFSTLEQAGIQLLRAAALFLRLPENYFDEKVTHGNSILRAIHYYPIENPELLPPDAVRAAAHGDINLITLLMGASAEGLQVLRRDDKWIPITALPEQIVVNVGDMLERLTNNALKSTIHRVVNPPADKLKSPRFSIPFFMHPRSEVSLACLNDCISAENPKQYEDITAGEFLNQRLAEIGLSAAKK
jgi:isopenicillin N synthase-like dioxygenase